MAGQGHSACDSASHWDVLSIKHMTNAKLQLGSYLIAAPTDTAPSTQQLSAVVRSPVSATQGQYLTFQPVQWKGRPQVSCSWMANPKRSSLKLRKNFRSLEHNKATTGLVLQDLTLIWQVIESDPPGSKSREKLSVEQAQRPGTGQIILVRVVSTC